MAAGGSEAAAPLLAARRRGSLREGCPGCRLDEINKAKTGIPYLNFFYIWVVCLCACDIKSCYRQQLSVPLYMLLDFGLSEWSGRPVHQFADNERWLERTKFLGNSPVSSPFEVERVATLPTVHDVDGTVLLFPTFDYHGSGRILC